MDHGGHSSLDIACCVDTWVILRDTVRIADPVTKMVLISNVHWSRNLEHLFMR